MAGDGCILQLVGEVSRVFSWHLKISGVLDSMILVGNSLLCVTLFDVVVYE